MIDTLMLKGKLILKNHDTGEVVLEKNNLIVNVGKNLAANILSATSADYLKTINIGTSNVAVSASDTDLGTSIFSKAFDAVSITGNTISFSITTSTSDANATWKEVGIKSNLGVLFNRINVDYTKTSANSIDVIFEITMG